MVAEHLGLIQEALLFLLARASPFDEVIQVVFESALKHCELLMVLGHVELLIVKPIVLKHYHESDHFLNAADGVEAVEAFLIGWQLLEHTNVF